MMNIASLPRESRERLLDGPTVSLRVTYSATSVYHRQQLLAAEKVVASDRYRQFCDQAKVANSVLASFNIEFPERALKAASPLFAEFQPDRVNAGEHEPSTYFVDIEMGQVLPGYLMEVLDWYCAALRAKSWRDFLPVEPSVQERDKYFWLYIYITMRKLGMDDFASSLGEPFITTLIEQHQLVDDAGMLDFTLEQLSADDPLFEVIAERYVLLEETGKSPIFPEQWATIVQNYAHFARLVVSLQRIHNELSGTLKDAEAQLERLEIGDGAAEDMES